MNVVVDSREMDMVTLASYCEKTEYCDADHPDIQKLAYQITLNCGHEKEKAMALFYWVRDNIIYRVGLWNRKASETIYEREGTCTNKANVLVALLRACQIPAGYGLLKVDGRRYWGPATPPMIAKHVGKIGIHLYVGVYLNQWIRIDPSDDCYLCNNIGYINPTATLLEWDGKKDAIIPIDPKHIFSNQFPFANIDHIMKKAPKNAKGIKLSICNVFIKYLRETKQRFSEPREVETAFLAFLRVHHPLYFKALLLTSNTRGILEKLQNLKNTIVNPLGLRPLGRLLNEVSIQKTKISDRLSKE